ncbi:type I methionyl aminopeptidase [Candidatus Falkowbacteria bacterium]|nr:type I methionyl aminopeptidase [Candidatus Falkowbacteria bacterium]
MIKLKTPQEIEIMKQGGKILSRILNEVIKKVKPGASTKELDNFAEEMIIKAGGRPSFKGYKTAWSTSPFPTVLCISINDEVVHGLPIPNRLLKNGDIVGLDCGLEYKKYFTDMSRTVAVGRITNKARKLINIAQEALGRGLAQVKPGNHISDIAKAIQSYVERHGFSVVRQLVGHGVGQAAHEEPQIPNYVDKNVLNIKLQCGMTLALEPMVNLGGWEVETLADGWTVVTKDGSLSAHFEDTVAVTEKGYEVLTK